MTRQNKVKGVTKVTSFKRKTTICARLYTGFPACRFETVLRKKVIGKRKLVFVAGVTDNGESGTNDVFSIQLSNSYSAGGYPLNGDISIHYDTSGFVEKRKLLFC
jgi:hypothetical protein